LFGELASVEKIQAPRLLSGEQSNSSVIYGDRMILKFFRRIEEGGNPDLEIGTFLTEKTGFRHIARIAGSLEYEMPQGQRTTQAIMQEFVANRGDAWRYTQEILRAFYERVGERLLEQGGANVAEPPEFSEEAMARLLAEMELLGQRTAELHLALSSEADDGAFAAEPFTAKFQSELLSSVEQLTHRTMGLLRLRMSEIPAEYKREAADLAERENEVGERFRYALTAPIDAMRIRIHGDYHLGQVLYTGSDFVIIDFEGEPARPLAERRVKQSPLQDVGGMLRSFHYAAFAPILTPATGHVIPRERVANLSNWAEEWSRRAGDCFLDRYYETSGEAAYLPSGARERARLLEMYLLAKAIYELGYELNNRPTWVGIPLEGIVRLLAARE
jgi:maltose alpha-D-glucosyltransferase/alpha-amylase